MNADTASEVPDMAFFELDLGDLSEFAKDINLDEIDEGLQRFSNDKVVKDALEKGVDLRHYAKQIEEELRAVEMASIQDYITESENLALLHHQIRTCDGILEKMESMLSHFQADLGDISSEIKNLQDKSLSMNIQLQNRKEVEQKLSVMLDQLVIAPSLIYAICDDEVNEAYLEHLKDLTKKIEFCSKEEVRSTMAAQDAWPELERLKIKAISRVRDFLMEKINRLKKPKTNIQILQQNVLLKYKSFVHFLEGNHLEVAAELRNAYVDTMGRMYAGHFKTYMSNLAKLQLDIATKQDLIGLDNLVKKAGQTLKDRGAVFALGSRDQVLAEVEAEPIIFHIAMEKKLKFPYEALFRSACKLLLDTSTSEFLFLIDFFGDRDSDLFMQIFTKTLSIFYEQLENYLFSSNDSVGLLIMIRLIYQFRLVMQKRRVPVLDSFFDRVNMMLWPRFKSVFDANVESIKKASYRPTDASPHFVTRRYAEFACSIWKLNVSYNDELVINHLAQLRLAFDKLLLRMAREVPNLKMQMVFLINNYDLVMTVANEQHMSTDDPNLSAFEGALRQKTSEFVELELGEVFPALIKFVLDTETRINSAKEGELHLALEMSTAERLVRSFSDNYKAGLEAINSDVANLFSNFRNGNDILKATLMQLLLYYTRFQETIKKCSPSQPAFMRDMVSTHSVMYEIKKFNRTFE